MYNTTFFSGVDKDEFCIEMSGFLREYGKLYHVRTGRIVV